jgi:L-ascorbate metabolism protein UlaG (beta-lactamase superfamily)
MGFFLRSAGQVVGIDLQWEGGQDEMKKIASQIDVLFVSHPHDDHYSIGLMKAVLDAGKPVVMSADIMPEYPSRWKIIVDRDNLEGMKVNGVSFCSCLGDQGPDAPNNVFVIKVGDWSVAQNGDNAVPEAEAFLSGHKVDVLITACWNGFKRTMDYIRANPEGTSCIYIPAHENEWLHTVDHREAYCELFSRKDRFGDPEYDYFPSVIMDAAGDSYVFER